MYKPDIPIKKLAINGLIINLRILNLIFTFLFRVIKLIVIDITWQITVASAAPATPPSIKVFGFIFTNIRLSISFTNTPTPNDITGTVTFPSPCSAPFTVCSTRYKNYRHTTYLVYKFATACIWK